MAVNGPPGGKALCKPCNRALEADRLREQDRIGPATEAQASYARSLRLQFPATITKWELQTLLNRHVEDEEVDQAPRWLFDYAREVKVETNTYHGRRELYRMIHRALKAHGDGSALAAWFVYNVAKDHFPDPGGDPRSCGIGPGAVEAVATAIAANEMAMSSIERYEGDELIRFGEYIDSGGVSRIGGSKGTKSYRLAAELLRAAGYPVP